VDKTLEAFVHETASELPAPGGGSIAAVMGSLAAALATMVANLSAHKRGWDDRWEEFSDWAEKGKVLHDELLSLVDADTHAFNKVMQTFGLPKSSEAERAARHQAIQEATRGAIQVPMRIMQRSHDCFEVIRAMAESGLPASMSDVGVAALAARAGVMGAFLNVKINVKDLDDHAWVDEKLAEGQRLQDAALAAEKAVLEIVGNKI
jgi:glutamate formiminotransferase/formiminotetrahydrofolate cyclodeaminase